MPKNYRFINSSGELNVKREGVKRAVFSDAYHALLALQWRYFICWLTGIYFGINVLFACLYMLGGDCIAGAKPGSFVDAFFFSIQTLSTIGYGTLAPKTLYADCLVTLQAFTGMLLTAMSTGLLFSKFSRPTSRIRFTERAVINVFNDIPTLMFRTANMRGNQIVDATVSVNFARFEHTDEGERYRRFYDVTLHRKRTSMFSLTWTLMHSIDEQSPLYRLTGEDWDDSQAELLVSISGVDGTFGQTVHARHSYIWKDVVEHARFEDMLSVLDDAILHVDYAAFDVIHPLED